MQPCIGCGTPCEAIDIAATNMETGVVTTISDFVCDECAPLLEHMLVEVP